MKRLNLNSKSGITLVEVLVSIFILGIAAFSMIVSFMMPAYTAETAKHHIQAMGIARQKMEELKHLGYNAIVDSIGTVLITTNFANVTIDDGGTANEDFDNDGILDTDVYIGNGTPIAGTREDVNSNGQLDRNSQDDILGSMNINIGIIINLNDNTTLSEDDAIPINITVSWPELQFGRTRQAQEIVENFISKEGDSW